MPATEVALMYAKGDHVSTELLAALDVALDKQDAWCRSHQPDEPVGRKDRHVSYWEALGPHPIPGLVLTVLTTRWASKDAHTEWLVSDENKAVFASLASHFSVEGDTAPKVLHINTELLGHPALESAETLTIKSTKVSTGEKDGEHALSEIQGLAQRPIWHRSGWQVEKEVEGVENHWTFALWDGPPDEEVRELEKNTKSSPDNTLVSLKRVL